MLYDGNKWKRFQRHNGIVSNMALEIRLDTFTNRLVRFLGGKNEKIIGYAFGSVRPDFSIGLRQ